MQSTHTLTQMKIYRPAGLLVSLLRALSAENLKLKRSLALTLACLIPLVNVALQVLLFLQRGRTLLAGQAGDEPWLFFFNQILLFWNLLFLPLFITLETALVAQLDHASGHWKHLYALSLPRWSIYAAKLLVNLGIVALSSILLGIFGGLAGQILRWAMPGLGFEQPLPFQPVLIELLAGFAASWLIIAIHTYIALNWRSFVVASTVGVVMTIAGILIISGDYGIYYPWGLSTVVVNGLHTGEPYLSSLLLGSLGGVAAALLSGALFVRKDTL